jgi:hypothetical protein
MTKLKFEEPDFDATFRLLYSPSRILQEVKKWHKSKAAQLSRQKVKVPDFTCVVLFLLAICWPYNMLMASQQTS